MALVHFHGLAAEREAEHLMAEQIPKVRRGRSRSPAGSPGRVFAGRRRIAGPWREKTPSGFIAKNVCADVVAGTTVTLPGRAREQAAGCCA